VSLELRRGATARTLSELRDTTALRRPRRPRRRASPTPKPPARAARATRFAARPAAMGRASVDLTNPVLQAHRQRLPGLADLGHRLERRPARARPHP